MKRHMIIILVLAITFSFVFRVPVYADTKKEVDKFSKASILIDQDTSRVLYAKNPDQKLPLASISKMMTFLIAIEAIKDGEVKSTDVIEITKDIAKVRGSSYKLREGEKVPLIELMKGLMIVSGNDAAIGIATHISGSPEEFVKRMNEKAKEVGMINTHFVNPHGLPIYDLKDPKALPKENISTVRDIATLGKYMFDNHEKEVAAVTDMSTYSNPDRGFMKNNTNPLLSILPEVDGIKTGYTGNAGYCLSFSMMVNKDEKNVKEHRLIGVVLGANHKNKRLSSSLALLKHGKENFHTTKLMDKDTLIGKKYIKGLKELEITLKTKDDFFTIVGNEENVHSEVTLKEIEYPIKKGDTLGVIKYYTDTGEILGSIDIVSDNDVNDASIKTKLKMLFAK